MRSHEQSTKSISLAEFPTYNSKVLLAPDSPGWVPGGPRRPVLPTVAVAETQREGL